MRNRKVKFSFIHSLVPLGKHAHSSPVSWDRYFPLVSSVLAAPGSYVPAKNHEIQIEEESLNWIVDVNGLGDDKSLSD